MDSRFRESSRSALLLLTAFVALYSSSCQEDAQLLNTNAGNSEAVPDISNENDISRFENAVVCGTAIAEQPQKLGTMIQLGAVRVLVLDVHIVTSRPSGKVIVQGILRWRKPRVVPEQGAYPTQGVRPGYHAGRWELEDATWRLPTASDQ